MGSNFIGQALRWRSRLVRKAYTLLISGQFRAIGRGTSISPPFRFANLGQIALGEGVEIHQDCWIHALKESPTDTKLKLTIKSRASIGMGTTISAAKYIEIGEYVLLARNVYISDHGHAFEN